MPEFLSEAWVRGLDGALRHAAGLRGLEPLVLEQVVRDVPGRGEVRYRVVVGPGGARAEPGGAPAAAGTRLRLTTDYATAVSIATGRANAQDALARGRLRLGGDVDVLVRRAGALAALDDVTASLRDATDYPPP